MPTMTCTFSIGDLIGFFSGELLPANADTAALKATENWKIIFTYFPVSVFLITIFGLLTIFTDDSIKFTILHKPEAEACRAISKFYSTKTKEEQLNIYHHIKSNSSSNSKRISYKNSICDAQYRRATWTAFVFIIFHILNGSVIIKIYSS